MASRVHVPDHVLVRMVDDELVLLNLDNEEFYGLDEVGSAIWEVVTGVGLEEGIGRLLQEFDVDEATLRSDVEHLLGDLGRRGLVVLDPP